MMGLRTGCVGVGGPAWKRGAQEWGKEMGGETEGQKGAVAL